MIKVSKNGREVLVTKQVGDTYIAMKLTQDEALQVADEICGVSRQINKERKKWGQNLKKQISKSV